MKKYSNCGKCVFSFHQVEETVQKEPAAEKEEVEAEEKKPEEVAAVSSEEEQGQDDVDMSYSDSEYDSESEEEQEPITIKPIEEEEGLTEEEKKRIKQIEIDTQRWLWFPQDTLKSVIRVFILTESVKHHRIVQGLSL